MRKLYAILVIGLVFASCRKELPDTGEQNFTVESNVVDETQPPVHTPVAAYISQNIRGYYKAIPANYNINTTVRYPVIIYFTGGGQYGNGSYELYRLLYEGLPRNIKEGKYPPYVLDASGKKVSFIVITPQLVLQPITPTCNLSCATVKSANLAAAEFGQLLTYVKNNFRVDPTRIYTSGMSLGVRTAVDLAAAFPTQVAAVVNTGGAPLYNTTTFMTKTRALAANRVAIWHLHNRSDAAVPYSEGLRFVNQVKAFSPLIYPKLTTFEDAYLNSVYSADRVSFPATKPSVRTKHDCWTFVLNPNYRENNMNVYQWMLQYSVGGSLPPQPPPPPPPPGGNAVPLITLCNDVVVKLSSNYWPNVYPLSTRDPDGYIVDIQWTKFSGPSTYTIVSPKNVTTRLSNLVSGVYVFRLTITDNRGASAYDDVQVTVSP